MLLIRSSHHFHSVQHYWCAEVVDIVLESEHEQVFQTVRDLLLLFVQEFAVFVVLSVEVS